MSCNCNPISQCNNCARGVPCNCPPVYPVPNTTVPCNCCVNGYVYTTADPKYPNGICKAINPNNIPLGLYTTTIPCVLCEEITTTDCVQYPGTVPITCGTSPGNIYGIIPGDSITTIISKMCITNENVIEALLTAISTSSRALAGFCQLVQHCGSSPGITVPVLSPITFTIP